MTLQEALTIGSKAEGSIKATYAELYNEKGEKLFSLQNTNAQYNISDLVEENDGRVYPGDIAIIRTANPKTLLFRDVKSTAKKGIGDVEDVNELDMTPYRLPVVKASVYAPNRNGLNPVTLTPEAREIILEKIMPKVKYYKLVVSYDVYKNGILGNSPDEHREEEPLYEGYVPYDLNDYYKGGNDGWHYGNRGSNTRRWYNKKYEKYKKHNYYLNSIARLARKYFNLPSSMGDISDLEIYHWIIDNKDRYKKLLSLQDKFPEIYANIKVVDKSYEKAAAPYAKLAEIIKDNGTLYAKPVAFDWSAIDLKNATVETEDGTEINLNDAIQAAQEELQQAKNMLYLAGASSLF